MASVHVICWTGSVAEEGRSVVSSVWTLVAAIIFPRDFGVEVDGVRDLFSCTATGNYNMSSGTVHPE